MGELTLIILNGPSHVSSNLVHMPGLRTSTESPTSNGLSSALLSHLVFLSRAVSAVFAAALSCNVSTRSILRSIYSDMFTFPASCSSHALYNRWRGVAGSQPCLAKKGLMPVAE